FFNSRIPNVLRLSREQLVAYCSPFWHNCSPRKHTCQPCKRQSKQPVDACNNEFRPAVAGHNPHSITHQQRGVPASIAAQEKEVILPRPKTTAAEILQKLG